MACEVNFDFAVTVTQKNILKKMKNENYTNNPPSKVNTLLVTLIKGFDATALKVALREILVVQAMP